MRLRRRLPAWLAIVAMTLHGLWPLLAHAKPREASLLVPTCTINGVTHYVELPAGKTPLEQRSASHHEHCKLCVFGALKLAAISLPDLPVLHVDAGGAVRIVPAPAVAWASQSCPPAPARAPPVSS